jgi:hypothetical protein
MARYDKDNEFNKPKGQMSVREAASMEMEEHTTETLSMRGKAVHGFGNGTDTSKRHTGTRPMDMQPPSAGESVTRIMDMIFQLPFHAQLSVMRMMAPRVLGAMDARDLDNFLRDLRSEISTSMEPGEEGTGTHATDTPDIQGT